MVAEGVIKRGTRLSRDRRTWVDAENFGLFDDSSSLGSDADEQEWYVSPTGKEGFGPLSKKEVAACLKDGSSNSTSLVWRGNEIPREITTEPAFAPLFQNANDSQNSNDNTPDYSGYASVEQEPIKRRNTTKKTALLTRRFGLSNVRRDITDRIPPENLLKCTGTKSGAAICWLGAKGGYVPSGELSTKFAPNWNAQSFLRKLSTSMLILLKKKNANFV